MSALAGACLGFVLYTYVGFPLYLWLRARRRPAPRPRAAERQWPAVDILIAAYNEAAHIEAKLASLAALDYPPGRWRVIWVDDGSEDGGAARVAAAAPAWLELIALPRNGGKSAALNAALAAADAGICVLMDARQRVDPGALKALLGHFDDPQVGAVSGELIIFDEGGAEQANMGLYWRYEKQLREWESRCWSTTGATGALYAIRRALLRPLPVDCILDDFDWPLAALAAGRRVLFEPRARVYDRAQASLVDESRRKVRTLSGNFQSFARHRWLFSPRRNRVWWQFLSHKVFRLAVPWVLLLLLPASALAGGPGWGALFAAQLAFYALALAAGRWPALRRQPAASFARTFVGLNLAAARALLRYLGGGLDARWKA